MLPAYELPRLPVAAELCALTAAQAVTLQLFQALPLYFPRGLASKARSRNKRERNGDSEKYSKHRAALLFVQYLAQPLTLSYHAQRSQRDISRPLILAAAGASRSEPRLNRGRGQI